MFTNISYSLPIVDLEAEWVVPCRRVSLGCRPGAQLRCDAKHSKVILNGPTELSARAWTSASFSSSKPLSLPQPEVKAFRPKVVHTGVIKEPVEIIPKDLFDELQAKYSRELRKALLIGIFVIALIIVFLRYVFREPDNAAERVHE